MHLLFLIELIKGVSDYVFKLLIKNAFLGPNIYSLTDKIMKKTYLTPIHETKNCQLSRQSSKKSLIDFISNRKLQK